MHPDPYDVVAYRGMARRTTHPATIATQAHLFGFAAADPDRCHVLEIGCGDGANLIPMAVASPGSTFVGIDLAHEPIERARQAARNLAVANVEFVVGDLAAPPDTAAGPFDFIIAHGVYSWIPPTTREALWSTCARLLGDDGVAFVSYNAYPGSHARDAIRELMRVALEPRLAPQARIQRARAALAVVAAGTGPVAEHARQLQLRSDWGLFHDELAEICDAFYVHEVVAHAAAHDLAFVFDARLSDFELGEASPEAEEVLRDAAPDVVSSELLLDFARNRLFRESLFRRGPLPMTRDIDPARLSGMWVSGRFRRRDAVDGQVTFDVPTGTAVTVADGAAADLLGQLDERWPRAIAFDTLVADLDARTAGDLAASLIQLHASGGIDLSVREPIARRAGDRPRAFEWVRWEVRNGNARVTNALHDPIEVEDERGRRLLELLDGTRSRAELVTELDAGPDTDAQLDAALEALSVLCLLEG